MQLRFVIGLSVIVGISDGLIKHVVRLVWRGVNDELDIIMVAPVNIRSNRGWMVNMAIV